jgi:hypothetical protein
VCVQACPDAADAIRIEGIIEAMRMPSDNMFGGLGLPSDPETEQKNTDTDEGDDDAAVGDK